MDIASTWQPMETIFEILSKLHGKDLVNAVEVCATFHNAATKGDGEMLWKARCEASNINMNLFKSLRYSSYRDMFTDQVILKSYTFIMNDRCHLKFAVLGNMLLIIVCQYERDSNYGIGYRVTLPLSYFFYDPKLDGEDFKNRTEEQDYQRCFVSHKMYRYHYCDNPYGLLLTRAVNQVGASTLINEYWRKAAFKNHDGLSRFYQSNIYEMQLFAIATLKELLLFGEVRYLLGRSFSFILPKYQHKPVLIDLDEDETLNIIHDGYTWLPPMFLYYHRDSDVGAMVPNYRMPSRFHEWIDYQKSAIFDSKDGWGYVSNEFGCLRLLQTLHYKSYYEETYEAASRTDRYYHLDEDYSADYHSDEDDDLTSYHSDEADDQLTASETAMIETWFEDIMNQHRSNSDQI